MSKNGITKCAIVLVFACAAAAAGASAQIRDDKVGTSSCNVSGGMIICCGMTGGPGNYEFVCDMTPAS
jgi:hypothetical protein